MKRSQSRDPIIAIQQENFFQQEATDHGDRVRPVFRAFAAGLAVGVGVEMGLPFGRNEAPASGGSGCRGFRSWSDHGWITKRSVKVRSPAVMFTMYTPPLRSPFRSSTVFR